MDKHTPEQRRKNMQSVRAKGSKIEQTLAKELWKKGLSYRKHAKQVYGKPDFVFLGLKIAIFCDSEFWHGKHWEIKKHEIKTNISFWHKKIGGNIKRDIDVNTELISQGWTVVRFWGKDILKRPDDCATTVENIVRLKKHKK